MPADSPYEIHLFYGRLEVEGRRVVVHVDHERRRIIVSIHPADSDADRLASLAAAIRDDLNASNGHGPLLGDIRIVSPNGRTK